MAHFSSIAKQPATAADCPRIINTGSIRMEPYAIWLLETQTGTNSGAGQLTLHQLLSLKAGDVVKIVNYTYYD